ncbi:MAG: hypothetical protein LQ349_003088 [Xanthoria aureola]|nr:MAG: hypothetical protein LQ349_003088 [Xanthoria aureola]
MSPSDYTSAKTGTLRLKGVHPTAKIQKPKKKRPKPSSDPTTSVPKSKKPAETPDHADPDPDADTKVDSARIEDEERDGGDGAEGVTQQQLLRVGGKTEAELRHEERRRRRLEDRLKREGTKTHKEKVEEFNHYLSNLSEHHDMPRIGPG